MTSICAWCHPDVNFDENGEPVSHDICSLHLEELYPEPKPRITQPQIAKRRWLSERGLFWLCYCAMILGLLVYAYVYVRNAL